MASFTIIFHPSARRERGTVNLAHKTRPGPRSVGIISPAGTSIGLSPQPLHWLCVSVTTHPQMYADGFAVPTCPLELLHPLDKEHAQSLDSEIR